MPDPSLEGLTLRWGVAGPAADNYDRQVRGNPWIVEPEEGPALMEGQRDFLAEVAVRLSWAKGEEGVAGERPGECPEPGQA